MGRRQHTQEEIKKKRLHDHKKRREHRRMNLKVIRDLSSEFQASSPTDSAMGSSYATDTEQLQGSNSTRGNTQLESFPKPSLEPPIENDGLPANPIWEIARKETNAIKMKLWAEKRENWLRFGNGSEPEIHHAIKPKEKPCKFEAAAEKIIQQSLGVVERYAIHQYTKELKERERSAIGMARMYRNKFEKSQVDKARTEMAAVVKQQEQRQFYRNALQEGGTRAGLIFKLAKEKVQSRSRL